MVVAPRMSVFALGKEGEAGHPRMVDAARRGPKVKQAIRVQIYFVRGSLIGNQR